MTSTDDKKTVDLDKIFVEIGDFGLFQIFIYALISMPVLLISWFTFEFVFTAGRLEYRCKIPGCDLSPFDDYLPNWTRYAIPHSHNVPSQCLRYEFVPKDSHLKRKSNNCDEMLFNKSHAVTCTEFIYRTDELTVLKEFKLNCEENEWKLAIIGTVKNVAELIMLPFFGLLSDRYGRRKLLIYSLACCGVFGVIMAFTTRYWTFLLLEFITGICASGIYNVIFVLGMEMVSPRKRVLGGSLIAFLYSTGQVFLGLIAMKLLHFRKLLLALYLPTFVVLTYIWVIPESVRWLLSKDRRKDASDIIFKAARMNQKVLSEGTIESLCHRSPPTEDIDEPIEGTDQNSENTFAMAMQNPPVRRRLVQCCFCWFSTALVYYGLSILSVNLHGNKFINFISFSLAEYPPIITIYFFLDKVGRKYLLSGSLFFSGITCVIPVMFITGHTNVWRLFLLGMSKCSVTVAFTILYVYTCELFPTNLRQSAMSLCSAFGSIGAMVAPQTPLLIKYLESLPFAFFSTLTIISGMLVVFLPETANKKLPDTAKEL
ncbi:Organic cation transporter-like protein [Pseudolycoriella hygida]|uniref:Organic cation transporter-like protein n=1 Tax=Pseudolycoriella hygida TaxID=35572 RepID=A0A9Q0MQM2_9DIPT|nr:Organic cation transporter-like protein [Pseudolycoriella hygida]